MANWLAQYLDRNPEIARLPVYKRDRYSLHVRQRDGSVQAEFSTRPLHYQDDHGIWQPLDTLLRAAGNEYGAPGLDVFLAPDGGVRVAGTKHRQRTGRVVVLDIATGRVKRIVASDLGVGRIEDDSLLRDAGMYQHRLRVTATGLREELTINGPLGGTSAAEWLMIETEMQGRSLPDGWVGSLKWAGRYQFRPPVCMDAAGARIAARQYALRQGNRQMLYTGAPLAWLAGAAYPVVLDPDFSATAADGYVYTDSYVSWSDAHDTVQAFDVSTGVVWVGNVYQSGKGGEHWGANRCFLAFDTSSLGASSVQAATLLLATEYPLTLSDDVEITKLNWSAWNPVSIGNQEAVFDAALAASKDVVWCAQGAGLLANVYYGNDYSLDTSWISRTSTTYYGLLAKHDRDNVTPTTDERIHLKTSESLYPPILRVIYGEAAVDASAIAAAVRTELAAELAMLDVAVSSRLATAGYTAPLDAAGTRAAVGMAAANFDTQMGALSDQIDGLGTDVADGLDELEAALLGGLNGAMVTVVSSVLGGTVTVYVADTWRFTVATARRCCMCARTRGWPGSAGRRRRAQGMAR